MSWEVAPPYSAARFAARSRFGNPSGQWRTAVAPMDCREVNTAQSAFR